MLGRDWREISAPLRCSVCGTVGYVDTRNNWSEVINFNKALADEYHGRGRLMIPVPRANPGNRKSQGELEQAGSTRRFPMRTTILTAATLVLFSSAVMAQSTDTKSPATTGPAAQSDSMSKGDMSKDKMSKKKMAKSKPSTKMKKTDDKM